MIMLGQMSSDLIPASSSVLFPSPNEGGCWKEFISWIVKCTGVLCTSRAYNTINTFIESIIILSKLIVYLIVNCKRDLKFSNQPINLVFEVYSLVNKVSSSFKLFRDSKYFDDSCCYKFILIHLHLRAASSTLGCQSSPSGDLIG